MDDKLKKMVTQARARIIWGNPLPEVREWLLSEGLPAGDADAVIDACNQERDKEIRRLGVRNIIIGAGLTITAAVAVPLEFMTEITEGELLYYGALAGGIGIWWVASNVRQLGANAAS